MSSELVPATPLTGPVQVTAIPIPLMTYPEMKQMAMDICKGGLFPQLKTPEAALTLMLICQAKGLHPIVALERYDIINGRPAWKSAAMLAEFHKAGGTFQWEVSEDECVIGLFAFPGAGQIRVKWDRERAQRAQLWGKPGPWQTFPQQMLRSRCASEGVRALAPGVLCGIYSEDEVRDMPAPPQQQRIAEARPQNRRQQSQQPAAIPSSAEAIASTKAAFTDLAAQYGVTFRDARERGTLALQLLGRDPEAKQGMSLADWSRACELLADRFAAQAQQAQSIQTESAQTIVGATTESLQGEASASNPDMDENDEDLTDPFLDDEALAQPQVPRPVRRVRGEVS